MSKIKNNIKYSIISFYDNSSNYIKNCKGVIGDIIDYPKLEKLNSTEEQKYNSETKEYYTNIKYLLFDKFDKYYTYYQDNNIIINSKREAIIVPKELTFTNVNVRKIIVYSNKKLYFILKEDEENISIVYDYYIPSGYNDYYYRYELTVNSLDVSRSYETVLTLYVYDNFRCMNELFSLPIDVKVISSVIPGGD